MGFDPEKVNVNGGVIALGGMGIAMCVERN